MHGFRYPKRCVVEVSPGNYAMGDYKYSTIDGEYVIHLDGELSDHRWPSEAVEILDFEDVN